jgi:ribosome-binding protein aMBF1 (putative translation factor)
MGEREEPINFGTERNRRAYERLTPEQKEAVARIRAGHRAPEFRAEIEQARSEVREAYGPDNRLLELLASLRRERERLGLSLADVAERTGMDRGQIGKLETGKTANPTVKTLREYAHALGFELDLALRPLEATS